MFKSIERALSVIFAGFIVIIKPFSSSISTTFPLSRIIINASLEIILPVSLVSTILGLSAFNAFSNTEMSITSLFFVGSTGGLGSVTFVVGSVEFEGGSVEFAGGSVVVVVGGSVSVSCGLVEGGEVVVDSVQQGQRQVSPH